MAATVRNGDCGFAASPGARVLTWTSEIGSVLYATPDGWYGVRLDGETVTHEWQADHLTFVGAA